MGPGWPVGSLPTITTPSMRTVDLSVGLCVAILGFKADLTTMFTDREINFQIALVLLSNQLNHHETAW